MTRSSGWRVGGADGCPTIGAGIVPAARVEIGATGAAAPDDHFTAGPDCRVKVSASGCVGRADGCPTIGAGIIPPAGVQSADAAGIPAPDDHFAPGPHRRVLPSGSGRVGGAGWSPDVVGARYRGGRRRRRG